MLGKGMFRSRSSYLLLPLGLQAPSDNSLGPGYEYFQTAKSPDDGG
jgi:hypothetical protein